MRKLLPKQPGADRVNKGRTWADYKALAFEAQVLYVKHGLSAHQVAEKLDVSIQTVSKWNKEGRWQELRPDFEDLKKYKAAYLYVEKGLPTNEISQALSISEITVKMWVHIEQWEAARQIIKANDTTTAVVTAFCEYFTDMFNQHRSEIEVCKTFYLKRLKLKE